MCERITSTGNSDYQNRWFCARAIPEAKFTKQYLPSLI